MLSKDEEEKLESIRLTVQTYKEAGNYPQLSAYDIEFLVKKLKECNDELKKF